jgi:hypothetical protein
MNLEQNRNEDWMKMAVSQALQHFEKIKMGGGKKRLKNRKKETNLLRVNVLNICATRIHPLSRSVLLQVLPCMRNRAVVHVAAPLQDWVM